MSDESYPGEAAASDHLPDARKMVPDAQALTREQVDKAFLGLYQEQHIKGNVGVTTTLILLHSHVAQQAQELQQWRKDYPILSCKFDDMQKRCMAAERSCVEFGKQLEQQAQEVERLKAIQRREPTENETICHACDGSGWVDR